MKQRKTKHGYKHSNQQGTSRCKHCLLILINSEHTHCHICAGLIAVYGVTKAA